MSLEDPKIKRMPFFQSEAKTHEGSNAALQLLLSRRNALASAAALALASTATRQPANAQPETIKQAPVVDAFGAGVLKAPGKLVVLPDGIVEKSPADGRSYRALTLKNGLRVMLASDPTTDTAAAALDVHVGHFSDPDAVPGLAHFCEHMLFLGTEKYPKEGYLEQFLSVHGGNSNAYTDSEDTCYFFSVNQDSFEQALDIFSQFFISPLFTAQATDRELNAIESEHSKNLQTDSWRINSVEKLRGNPKHPFAKFGTGNKATLKDGTAAANLDLRDELLKFYKTYYSANQMTLVVCGRESLDTLQKWVVDRFSAVPNFDRPPPEFEWQGVVKPFDDSAAKTLYNIVPVQDQRDIYLEWVLPYKDAKDRARKLLAKPEYLVSSLLGHEGKGSILSYLKDEKGWVTSVGAAPFDGTQDFSIFGVGIGLTEEGLKHREEIIQCVFSYLEMVKKDGIPEYIGKELVELSNIFWQFQERREPQDLCTSVANNMHTWLDPRLYLAGPGRLRGIDNKLVDEFVKALTAESCVVTYISRDIQADKTEKWYGTRYSTEPIGDRLLQWSKPPSIPYLKVPAPNPFIPKDFKIKATGEKESDPIAPPSVVRDDNRWRVYYKADKRYGKPKAAAYFQLKLNKEVFGENTNPRVSALCKLLKASLGDALNEYAYDAGAAGFNYNLVFTVKGPQITFSGYNDKLPEFVSYVSKAIASHMPSDEEKFKRFKDSISRELQDFITQQPFQHAILFGKLYLDAPAYTPLQVLEELKGMTLKDLQQFTSWVWKEAHGEALIQGNLDQREALAMVDSLDKAISFKPLPESEWAQSKLVKIPVVPEGYGTLLSIQEPNPNNPNSAVVVQVQSSDRDVKEQVAFEVLASIFEQPFYADLRTRQQLGYIVSAGVRGAEGVRSLSFTVQSSVADPAYMTEKIFEFLEKSSQVLESVTDKEFKTYVEGLVDRKLEKEKKLSSEVLKHWGEISQGQYVFDRAQREAAALRDLTKEDILRVFNDAVRPQGKNRRIFVAQVASQKNTKPSLQGGPPAPGTQKVPDSPESFRNAAGYFPRETVQADGVLRFEPLPQK